jgi:competence protein ComGC
MKIIHKHTGLTLTEMTVVIAVAALLVGLSMPAARMLQNSFETEGGTASMISSALASARAIAAKEQRYAGIRFQKAYSPDGVLKAPQYIIFIIQDPEIMAFGFRAVDGIEPIKLPDSIGVMDLMYHPNLFTPIGDGSADSDTEFLNPNILWDTTTFSIVFSPSGKLVIHDVQVRNRDGIPDSAGRINDNSGDDIFNKKLRVDAGLAMFYQDDYFNASWSPWIGLNLGLGPEPSRNGFVIYETKIFNQTNINLRWTGYLSRLALKPVYINAYTGTIVSNK